MKWPKLANTTFTRFLRDGEEKSVQGEVGIKGLKKEAFT